MSVINSDALELWGRRLRDETAADLGQIQTELFLEQCRARSPPNQRQLKADLAVIRLNGILPARSKLTSGRRRRRGK